MSGAPGLPIPQSMGLWLPRFFSLALVLGAALVSAGGAASSSNRLRAANDPLEVGIASEEPKWASDGGSGFYSILNDLHLTASRLVIPWNPTKPDTIPEQEVFDRLVPQATGRGVTVYFVITGSSPWVFGSADNRAMIGPFLQQVARRYPQVTQYVLGNEPNVTYFWRPQFSADGQPVSPAAFVDLLARGYDALKAVNPAIRISAGGLDARGNDDPGAPSNISISPTRFISYMGQIYRGSGRGAPLFDEVSFHPYPQSAKDALLKSYAWPNAGVADLNRLKQAYWDAFHGTAQPTVEEGLTFNLDETGWQVAIPADHASSYEGREVTAVTDEATQAQIYGEMIQYLACDPSVRSVQIYRLMDDSNLAQWQSGLIRADNSHRPAYDAVKQTIAATGGRCAGPMRPFQHALTVVGAAATFQIARKPGRATAFSFTVTAEENATAEGRILRVTSPEGLSRAQRNAVTSAFAQTTGAVANGSTKVQARWAPVVKFPEQRLKAGWYVYAVKLASELNPERTSTFASGAFRVG